MSKVDHLDAIERTGQRLGEAVDVLDRTHLRALGDRLDLVTNGADADLRRAIKRRLLGVKR